MAHILSRTLSCDPFVALWDGVASLSLSFGVPLASLGIPWGAYRIAIHFLCKCTKIIDNTAGLIQLEFAPPSAHSRGQEDEITLTPSNYNIMWYYAILCNVIHAYSCKKARTDSRSASVQAPLTMRLAEFFDTLAISAFLARITAWFFRIVFLTAFPNPGVYAWLPFRFLVPANLDSPCLSTYLCTSGRMPNIGPGKHLNPWMSLMKS